MDPRALAQKCKLDFSAIVKLKHAHSSAQASIAASHQHQAPPKTVLVKSASIADNSEIAELAWSLIQQPKQHFYSLYSILKAAEKAGELTKTNTKPFRGCLYWVARIMKYTPFLPAYRNEKAIFDRFGKYRPSKSNPGLRKAWEAVSRPFIRLK